MTYKVAQIIPYFGKWPVWFELYLYSCGQNPMVDYVFYTDCSLPKNVYKNTIFHKCTYKEYCNLISDRLNINYICEESYKLTDLKPFIGIIHQEDLEGYDFWGMGDIDLVYGNLGMIINDDICERYDVITTHNYHIAGHCCFLRNNDYYRNLCFKISNWKEKLTSNKALSLDELEWSGLIYPLQWKVGALYTQILKYIGVDENWYRNTMSKLLLRRIHLIEYYTSPIPQNGQEWIYDLIKNKIMDPFGHELPYLHFLFFKKTHWLDTDIYWKDGYWQVSNNFDKIKAVVFDCNSVREI